MSNKSQATIALCEETRQEMYV